MKNLFYKFASLLTCSAAVLYADLDDRIKTLEEEMSQISTTTPHDTLGASFTSAQPLADSSHWSVALDIIYWHTKMGGTEYAYTIHDVKLTPEGSPLPPLKGESKHNPFSWDLGFKTGIRYNLVDHDNWDLNAQYSWYRTNSSDTTYKPSPNGLGSVTWPSLIIASRASSQITLKHNNLDFEIGRSYFLSSRMSFRPHVGVKSSWLDIKRTVQYRISDKNTKLLGKDSKPFTGFDIKTTDSNHYWGLGPEFGIDSKWYLGYGVHILGDISTALLYSNFDTSSRDFVPPSTDPELYPDGQIVSIKHKFHRYIPFTQCFIGLGWGTHLNKMKQYIGAKIGYELQYYWRINQFYDQDDIEAAGTSTYRIQFQKQAEDIMFYGLTAEASLSF